MTDLTLQEAQLMRLLAGMFGQEKIVVKMSVLAICGGLLPEVADTLGIAADSRACEAWAKNLKCLFTIVDDEGNPKLVCEFCLHYWEEGDGTPFHGVQVINVEDLERQRWLRPIFKARQVHYITVSKEEFDEILAPGGQLEFLTFLQDRMGLLDE